MSLQTPNAVYTKKADPASGLIFEEFRPLDTQIC